MKSSVSEMGFISVFRGKVCRFSCSVWILGRELLSSLLQNFYSAGSFNGAKLIPCSRIPTLLDP
jgi:hypothetical protein